MSTIQVGGQLQPGTVDTPLDARVRVDTLSAIASIPLPFVGMTFFVKATGKLYVVKSLKSKQIGPVVTENAAIDEYEEIGAGAAGKPDRLVLIRPVHSSGLFPVVDAYPDSTLSEDDRVSGFQTEPGCIDRHIGSGFINQCDHADGNGNFFNIQPIGPLEFRESVTDRIGKSDDMPESVGDSLNAFFIQAESIQHGGRDSGFLSVFHIDAVSVQDGFCLRIESVGHGREPLIFLFGGRRCEFSGSVLCGTSHFLKSLSDFFD